MADSVLISREHRPAPPGTPIGGPPSSQRSQHGPPNGGIPITCNRCRRPLSTTVFLCACDCVFCEDCTYNHFNSSSSCPVCKKVLSESDFAELVVADPSATAQAGTRSSQFQALFTKQNSASRMLPFQDLCTRMLRQHDDVRASNKFLLKQFMMESTKQAQRTTHLQRAFDALKLENTSLKQNFNQEKMRFEKAVENANQQIAKLTKKIEEKDQQLHQFRKLHDRMTPQSQQQMTSRRVSHESSHGSDLRHPHHGNADMIPPGSSRQQTRQPPAPPFQGFMIQKEAQERARLRALEAPHQRTPIIGRPSHNPYPTPRSSGSQGSESGGIRDFSSSLSGYAMTSGGSGGSNQNPKRRAMSPSQAFANAPPGSYSVSRGPSNYFQQQGGYPGGGHR